MKAGRASVEGAVEGAEEEDDEEDEADEKQQRTGNAHGQWSEKCNEIVAYADKGGMLTTCLERRNGLGKVRIRIRVRWRCTVPHPCPSSPQPQR